MTTPRARTDDDDRSGESGRSASTGTEDSHTDSDTLVGVPSHPVAATVGALASAAAVGATIGTAAGPVGTAIGAVVGAVAGGLGGDAIASSFEQVSDMEHWRREFDNRPYVQAGDAFDDFGPAFAFGIESRSLHAGRTFEEVELELARRWEDADRGTRLPWERARHAARDAWERDPGNGR